MSVSSARKEEMLLWQVNIALTPLEELILILSLIVF